MAAREKSQQQYSHTSPCRFLCSEAKMIEINRTKTRIYWCRHLCGFKIIANVILIGVYFLLSNTNLYSYIFVKASVRCLSPVLFVSFYLCGCMTMCTPFSFLVFHWNNPWKTLLWLLMWHFSFYHTQKANMGYECVYIKVNNAASYILIEPIIFDAYNLYECFHLKLYFIV